MEITAEGVETEEQLLILKAAGCTNAQGYYFARPRPIADIDLRPQAARVETASQ
ncbi:cyclic-di-GMP phosphodiesterase [compost metagenome]